MSSRLNTPLFAAAALALCAATAAFAVWFAAVPGFVFWLGVVVMTVVAVGAVVWAVRVEGDPLSPLTLSAVFYFLTFAAGALYFWFNPALPGFNARPLGDRDHLPFAVVFGVVAFVLFAGGYMANPFRLAVRFVPALPALSRVRSPWIVIVCLLSIGWFARLILISQGLYFHTAVEVEESGGATWFIRTFSTLPLVATAYAGAYAYIRGGSRPGAASVRRVFWVLFSIEIVYATPTAERGMLVALALIYASVRFYGTGRLPWKGMLTASLLLMFLVFPFVQEYREGSYQKSPTQHLAKAQEETLSGQSFGDLLEQGADAALQRFVGVTSLVQISSSDRGWYTREPGETLGWIPFGFIPRAVFPDKEDPGFYGNEFGRSHAIIASNDYITAITPLQSGELYLNFGWLGVLFGMPLVGGLYRLLAEWLRERRTHVGPMAVYAVVAWPLISAHESILAVGAIGVVKTLLVYALVLFGVRQLAEAPARATTPASAPAVAR